MSQLPSLEIKYRKEKTENLTNTSSNTNTNTINNNIIINKDDSNSSKPASPLPLLQKSNSMSRIQTPTNISLFKEALLDILISYFKNNIVIINNLVELSDDIIMKLDDLKLLISLLLEIDKSNITIEVEEISTANCCGKICSHLPRYRKISEIIIDKKQSFKVSHNQYYIQMQTEFNISLDYVIYSDQK
jgi:hypothetical protein